MTPPSMDPQAAHRQARSQGLTGLWLIGAGVAAIAAWVVMELVSRYPFRGPNIGGGLVGVLGLVLIGVGIFLAVTAGRHGDRWWRRAPSGTPDPEQGGTT